MEKKSAQVSQPKHGRLLGLDVARSLAMLGMILIHFKIVFAEQVSSQWADKLITLLEGRSAGLFVVVAGVGISLLSKPLRENDGSLGAPQIKSKLVIRSLVLLLLGYCFATIWQADILHYYGVYILLSVLLLRSSNLVLWLVILGVVLDFLLMMLLFDYQQGWDFKALNYTEFWDWPGQIRHLLFNGFHPVFPWFSLFVFGMWLGRLNLLDWKQRQILLLVNLFLLVLIEGVSILTVAWFAQLYPSAFSPEDVIALFGTAPMPPMPQYIFSAAASSVVVIMVSLNLAEKYPEHWMIRSLVQTGRLALTIYLGHILIGISVFQLLIAEGKQTGMTIILMSGLFYLGCMLFGQVWLKNFERGPLELLMRRVAG